MTKEKLAKKLQSVGQACFVEYYELFASETISHTKIVETLKSKTPYTENSCSSRTSTAQCIIREGLGGEALRMVIDSRVAEEIKAKAKKILTKYFSDEHENLPVEVVCLGGDEDHSEKSKPKTPAKAKHSPLTKWPDWSHPTDEELKGTINLIAKYIRFLDPKIIEAIVEDNKTHKSEWSAQLKDKGIDPEIYLWEDSPCAFPGVRRYAGSKEIAFFKGHTVLKDAKIPDALRLDDNDFPKHVWAFTFTGKEFRKFGPNNYSLAHLADHKRYKNRFKENFDVEPGVKQSLLFGLYTCPTNIVYIPTSLIRPTDFSPLIRRLLLKKAFDLYGNICKIIPPWLKPRGRF